LKRRKIVSAGFVRYDGSNDAGLCVRRRHADAGNQRARRIGRSSTQRRIRSLSGGCQVKQTEKQQCSRNELLHRFPPRFKWANRTTRVKTGSMHTTTEGKSEIGRILHFKTESRNFKMDGSNLR